MILLFFLDGLIQRVKKKILAYAVDIKVNTKGFSGLGKRYSVSIIVKMIDIKLIVYKFYIIQDVCVSLFSRMKSAKVRNATFPVLIEVCIV